MEFGYFVHLLKIYGKMGARFIFVESPFLPILSLLI